MSMRNATPRALGMFIAAAMWSGTAGAASTAQLQHEWWQWVMSIPSSDSPVYDKTGNRCGVAQRGDVWFLAGATGGKITRKCALPADTALLVPVANNFCFPDAAYTDAACTSDTIAFIDSFSSGTIALDVDGSPWPVTRVSDTSDFKISVGANGFGGTKRGVYRATVADGYWGVVDSLSPGHHTIHMVAQSPAFSLDVTYEIDVITPSN